MAWGESREDLPDAQLLHHLCELGGFGRRLCQADVVLEGRMSVAVQGQRDSPLSDEALKKHHVAPGVFRGAEGRLGHSTGGVVHRQQQHKLRPPLFEPAVVTAIDLYQHALLGHAPPPEPVLRRAATARAAHACPGQDAAHRGAAQVDALTLSEQFGKVGMVGAGVMSAGQLHHCGRGDLGDGVVGPPPPVAVGQCGGTVSAIGREKTLGVALAQSHDLRSLGDG